jgi:SAM-dependent methyltransferase
MWAEGLRPVSDAFHLVELGCGDGSNLLPLAFYNPRSTFIGIDNCRSQLDRARAGASCVGLKNIDFVLKDIRDLDAERSIPCDYVIAHGVYSWVSRDVRNALLAFCERSLAPAGVTYISYNAQPGWATRNLVRETLLRARSVREAAIEEKARKAIEVADQLLNDLPSRDYASATLLGSELERVSRGTPFYVFHEYLAEVNDGFWFRDFAEAAQQYGLHHVTDAQFCRWEGYMPENIRMTMASRDVSPVDREERADLLCHRSFRASILCRADAPRTPIPHGKLLDEVRLATSLHSESDPLDLTEGVVGRFRRDHGPEIRLDASITKAAVVLLAARWPSALRLEQLYHEAVTLLAAHGCPLAENAGTQLSTELANLFETGQIDVHVREDAERLAPMEYPKVHRLAAFEAERQDTLTSQYHVSLAFDRRVLAFIRRLDGSRSAMELRHVFGAELVEQTLPLLMRSGLLADTHRTERE